ncbi:MAG: hypothetical protein ACI8XO_000926 [Verrucomicrobiales bacterium]|jgi:hypothetical protein
MRTPSATRRIIASVWVTRRLLTLNNHPRYDIPHQSIRLALAGATDAATFTRWSDLGTYNGTAQISMTGEVALAF